MIVGIGLENIVQHGYRIGCVEVDGQVLYELVLKLVDDSLVKFRLILKVQLCDLLHQLVVLLGRIVKSIEAEYQIFSVVRLDAEKSVCQGVVSLLLKK